MGHRLATRVPFVLALVALHAAALVRPQDSFASVNWSLVSPTAIAAAEKTLLAPIGCTCVSTGGSGCPFFDCVCTCDLTAGACDPFCCCDAECTVDHVASVKQQGLCVDAEPIKPSVEYCSTDLTLKSVATTHVNPLLVDSVLCVAVDNNEIVGEYIATPAEQSMAVANAFIQNPKAYAFPTSEASSISTASSRATFQPGDLIPVFAASATASIHGPKLMGWGPMGTSTRCTRRNPVRFGIDWVETACTVDGLILEDVCEAPGGILDPSAIAESLLIATNPSVVSAASGPTVPVQIKTLQELNPHTGQVVPLSKPFPAYYPQPKLTMDTDNVSSCAGALLDVAYMIFHNGSGLIERVEATITIGTLSSASANTSSLAVSQSFSVRFASTASISRSLDRGNVASYERSGNPGYVLHRPVRVGVLAPTSDNGAPSNTLAIWEMADGLSLPGLGDCGSTSMDLPVLFGEDLYISCTLQLNASAFESFCERDTPVVADPLRVHFTHVARFGNSDPFLPDQWLEFDYDPPTKPTSTFTDASGTGTVEMTCKNVLSSLRMEFLVAAVGPVNNPQNKIIAARASHAKDEVWTFWKNPRDPAKQETYFLTTTVSFVTVQSSTVDQWIPPTPPIWFSIPNDVFYPFLLNDAGRSVDAPTAWTVLLWTIGMWTFVT